MNSKTRVTKVLLTVTLVFILAGAPLAPQAAHAAYEDAAIFYDELAQYGNWVEDEQYGPVWYPSQVEQDWRPYTDGRWTPSEQGYLFETHEPWGWATYHYGNWMPTQHYGWVWVPGRTWYPNTVAWRHSPENTPQDLSYIGWAPIPPPNYVAQPDLYSSYGGYSGYTGYSGGGGILDLIAAPFWIFAQASRFLLGFGQPYAPSYSYYGSGILAPPTYYQMIYPATTLVSTWYHPSYYRPTYFSSGTAAGAYCWGPPTRYVSRVTNINYVTIDNHKRRQHVNNVRGGWPNTAVFKRNPHLRRIVPSENPRNWARPTQVRNVQAAARHLGNPRAIVKPADLRPLPQGRVPKASALAPERRPQRQSFQVPQRAQQRFTPQMTERLRGMRPAGEGAVAPGRASGDSGRRSPQARPSGFVRPEGAQQGTRARPQGFQAPRGDRSGPSTGAERSRDIRRAPREGFQRPERQDVRRGPVATPATPATRATPATPGSPGTRATRAIPATPATRATPPSSQDWRRGTREGFQVPEQPRRQPMQSRQIRPEQQQRSRQQQPATRQRQLEPQQQIQRQQEQLRRQQFEQQQRQQIIRRQDQQRRIIQPRQVRQQPEPRVRQPVQPQQIRTQPPQRQPTTRQQVRPPQEQLRRQPVQTQQIRQQPARQPRTRTQPQQVRQERQPRQQIQSPQARSSRESPRQPRSGDQRAQRSPWGER